MQFRDLLTPQQRFYSRRELVRRTSLGVLGLGLADLLFLEQRAKAASAVGNTAKAKNVLVLLEQGGLSHIDTWE